MLYKTTIQSEHNLEKMTTKFRIKFPEFLVPDTGAAKYTLDKKDAVVDHQIDMVVVPSFSFWFEMANEDIHYLSDHITHQSSLFYATGIADRYVEAAEGHVIADYVSHKDMTNWIVGHFDPQPGMAQGGIVPAGTIDAMQGSTASNDFSNLARNLPGMESLVHYPCGHHSLKSSLKNIIMHLNDHDRWSREKIADWLDELHDAGEIDIEFKVGDDDPKVVTQTPAPTWFSDDSESLSKNTDLYGDWQDVGYTTKDNPFSKINPGDIS